MFQYLIPKPYNFNVISTENIMVNIKFPISNYYSSLTVYGYLTIDNKIVFIKIEIEKNKTKLWEDTIFNVIALDFYIFWTIILVFYSFYARFSLTSNSFGFYSI